MIGNSRILAGFVALTLTLAPPASAKGFTSVGQINEAGCNKLIQLLATGIGTFGDYSANLRWENGACRVTTVIPKDCGAIARWLGLDPDLLDSSATWSSVDAGCTDRYDEVVYRFDDPLGQAYLRYWNSKANVWWYQYNFEAAGFDVYGGSTFGFMTKYVDSVPEIAHADALEQAGFSFSADGLSTFDRNAFIAQAEAACAGMTYAFGEQILPYYALPEGFTFTGFDPPIGGADASGGTFLDPARAFKLNSTVPVKMRLTEHDGEPVTWGEHSILLVKFSSDTTSEPAIDATPNDGATSGNLFRRSDGDAGAWHFNLDTRSLSQGIWQVVATLSDGSVHTAFIELR